MEPFGVFLSVALGRICRLLWVVRMIHSGVMRICMALVFTVILFSLLAGSLGFFRVSVFLRILVLVCASLCSEVVRNGFFPGP